jgi:hypothetical protein
MLLAGVCRQSRLAGLELCERLRHLRQNPLGALLLLSAPDVVPQCYKDGATPFTITTVDRRNRDGECGLVFSHGAKGRHDVHRIGFFIFSVPEVPITPG